MLKILVCRVLSFLHCRLVLADCRFNTSMECYLQGLSCFEDNTPSNEHKWNIGEPFCKVGALNTCFLARRGLQVDLYEYRDDIRQMEHVPGRSINLALSIRGRSALRAVDLEDDIILRHGIPMHGRMIHNLDGTRRPILYGRKGQCIYSVGRRHLNELLLTAAEAYPNVNIHFQHKLIRADLQKGTATFEQIGSDSNEVTVKSDLLIGADGAFSVVRREMMKQPLFNFSQTYIKHAYKELCIPPNKDGMHAMEMNFLHIWPRGTFMMIALPNQDKSWTVTLFMPQEKFDSLVNPQKLVQFFLQNFPDAIPLIGEKKLMDNYFSVKPSYLVSIKCNPYHVGNTAVIMGDAAHAMVPFYGQGMNAGFEDCLIFNEMMEKHHNELGLVLREFSEYRNPDAEAICDLAMYNYIEMRDLVNSKMFLLRKKLDNTLHTLFPNTWTPLYSMVTFTRTRYHECILRRKWQDDVLLKTGYSIAISGLAAMVLAMCQRYNCIYEMNEIVGKFRIW